MSFPETQIKGSILVGSSVPGAASMTPLPPGPDGQVLTTDSTTPTGLKWAPGGAGSDIFAATRVVSLIPGDGTDLTIAAAIAALPAEGGYIYVKQGTYPLAATLTMPDKPVVIKGSGDGTILSLGASVIAAFTIPTGLASRREYVFEDFLVTGTSVANQRVFSVEDANANGVLHAVRVNSTGVQIPVDITDGTNQEVWITLDDCHFTPIADGSSVLINTPDLTDITAYVWMQRVRFFDIFTDVITGALTNDDGITSSGVNILGEDCAFSVGANSALGALNLTDSIIYNFGPGANPVISIFGDTFGMIPVNSMVGCSGQFVNFTIFGNGLKVHGGAWRACSFTDGAISAFTDAYFFGDLTADAAVIVGTGQTFIKGCYFDNQGTTFVLDGNFDAIVGNDFHSNGAGLTATIRTTNGDARISDNIFTSALTPAILEAGLTSTNRIDNNRWVTNPVLLAPSDAVVNGFKRHDRTGVATVDALTAVFTHQNDKGLAGAGSIKNTGANSLTVRRTVTDGYGTTAFQEDPVLPGASMTWPMDTAIGTALPAYMVFTVSVRSTVPGSPTTYSLRHSSTGAY